ncbi:MAG: hypothetical protein ACFFKA_02400 [Candidatus Thorarchaeota archaeon]
MGIDDLIATFVNRNIDYGFSWAFDKEGNTQNHDERAIDKQLKFFYHKDLEKTFSQEFLYVRAYYLHHLLDYFKETRYNIYDLELIFAKFIQEKVNIATLNEDGIEVNFLDELNLIFQIIRQFKEEFYRDLKGN